MDSYVLKRLLWGLIIVGLGVAFLLHQFGVIEFSIGTIISTFWPVILIVVGIDGLLGSKNYGGSGGGRWWGWFPLGFGLYFLGRNLGLYEFSIGDIIPFALPVVLIIFGVTMIFKPGKKHQEKEPEEWQAYSASVPIPPPPPLHPDPTKAGSFPDEETGAAEIAKEPERHGPRTHFGNHACHTSAPKHERVEWWNWDSKTQTRSGFIGDIHIGQGYWELKPLNISHFFGDTVLDLTKAQIPYGETKVTISSFIGDVKVFLPNDYEVGIQVVSSAFIGNSTILDRKEDGILKNSKVESPSYHESEKQIRLVVSSFIGDVRVSRVG